MRAPTTATTATTGTAATTGKDSGPTTATTGKDSGPTTATTGKDSGRLLWRIHGADYDLEHFAARHPGGEIALRLGQGTADATSLFESYHVYSDVHKRVLEQYRVKSSPEPARGPPSAFRADLERMLTAHFGTSLRSSRKATDGHLMLLAGMVMLTLACLVGWARGSLLAMLCLPMLHWISAVNCSHDGSHFTLGRAGLNVAAVYIALPLLYNPMTWYHQHVVSHHVDCNEVGKDVDLQHFAPMLLHPRDQLPKQGAHTLLDYLKLLAAGLHMAMSCPLFASGLSEGATRVYHNLHGLDRDFIEIPPGLKPHLKYRLLNLVGPASTIAFIAYPWFVHDSASTALLFCLFPYAASSLIFLAVTQSSHIQPEVQAPSISDQPDFFKRQAMGAVDYSSDSYLWGVLTGGLNNQALHHTLPHVNSCHYAALHPKFERVCLEHGIKLVKRRCLWHAMKTCFGYVWNLNNSARLLLFANH